jgi:membrane-associated phospholipid phosphatase
MMRIGPLSHPRRRGGLEQLEDRRLLAGGWRNPVNALDVDNSGVVTVADLQAVISDLRHNGNRPLPAPPPQAPPYLDVDGSDSVTILDALLIVQALREGIQPLALTASLHPDSDANGNGVVLEPQVTLVGQTMSGASLRLRVAASPEDTSSHNAATEVLSIADIQGRYQFTMELSPGLNTLVVEATDRFGQRATVERTARYGDVVLDWNASLLNVIRDWTTLSNDPYPNRIVPSQPPRAARNLAMVHAAMYDAVNAIERTHQPYHVDLVAPAGASPVAAAAAAAHHVASQLYQEPDERAVFDAALAEALATVPDGPAETLGVEVGRQAAEAMLAWRSADGAGASAPYSPGGQPGDWNRTFPDYLPPLLPQWPLVTPFAMSSPSQFRPAAPPALGSAEYAAAVDEVQRLGGLTSTERTAEQTEIALFWADGGGTFTPPGHWNQIAADVALARGTTLTENARLFALLNIALADAGIASWEAKYAYDLWRPIDAIRRGETDGNDLTAADPRWMPLLKTPPFPSYTSGHSTFSGAADAVLSAFFGAQAAFTAQSDSHSGFTQRPLAVSQVITRQFDSFAQAAEEAGRSRIYGGIHFDFDNSAGLATGRALGALVVDTLLRPIEPAP